MAALVHPGWKLDVVEADSQPRAHPWELLFQGHKCGQAPGEFQKRSKLGRVWGWKSVIAGSVEEADAIDPGSVLSPLGAIQIEHRC